MTTEIDETWWLWISKKEERALKYGHKLYWVLFGKALFRIQFSNSRDLLRICRDHSVKSGTYVNKWDLERRSKVFAERRNKPIGGIVK